MPLLELHGADALRYWAASGRPGTDTAIDEAQMKNGRRLAIKMLNASKFVLGRLEGRAPTSVEDVTEPLDRDLLAHLAQIIDDATTALSQYDYARALERTESFFWSFCDNYVELVKTRAYRDDADPAALSARATLTVTLSALQRLFAPVLPFVSEEVWRWWHDESVHQAAWPTLLELGTAPLASGVYPAVNEVLEAIRREKSVAKVSQRKEVRELIVRAPGEFLELVRAGEPDLVDAGAIVATIFEEAGDLTIAVTLAPDA
jgi:valyl-tRNA synthetase